MGAQARAEVVRRRSLEQVRSRFRTHLEIDGVPAFWEDRMIGDLGDEVPLAIGRIKLSGMKTHTRCIVPRRSAEPGNR